MQELISLRKPREKYWKHSNGIIDIHIYDSDIHYKKKDHYENIDNTWVEKKDIFHNKANAYQIRLNRKPTEELISYNHQEKKFTIILPHKSQFTKIFQKNQKIFYQNILKNIDITYQFIGNDLKDNIILKEIENDFSNLKFHLKNAEARLEKNQLIIENNNQFICKLEPPTLTDNQNNNYPINYILDKSPDGDIFSFNIDENILKNKNIYPLTIDPILSNTEKNSVYDTYIYEGDESVDRNSTDMLKVGVDKDGKVYRSLLKFDLPTIGTGCDIVGAKVALVSHVSDYSFVENYEKCHTIAVHEMTKDWLEETANWNQFHESYQEKIEDYFTGIRTLMSGHYPDLKAELKEVNFDVTNLVKRWYAGSPNYGILLKAIKEEYIEEKPEHTFYSKNNTITETTNPKPFLIISYRNINGLESYMTYQNISHQDGVSYINNLTGNLTSVFLLNQTIGSKLPISLNYIYNTNDVTLKKDYGYGLGCKLNYHQTLKEIKIEDQDYIEYLDEDGTEHYFYKNENTYYDEDGLNLTISKENEKYILKDKLGNQKIFIKINDKYFLEKIIDTEKNTLSIEYNNQRIVKITDSEQESVIITYNSNGIVTNSNYTTSLISLDQNKIIRFTTKNGTTTFTYQNNYINKIKENNGKSIKFEYFNSVPYRLKKFTELGTDNEEGVSLEYDYGFQVTRIKDAKGRINTYTFNKLGNTTGITNLKTSDDFVGSYGNYRIYDDMNEQSKNKLILDSGAIKYTNNMFIEREKTINGSNTIELPTFYQSGKYTISGLFKTTGNNISLDWIDRNNSTQNTINISKSNEFQKYVMTVEVQENNLNQYTLKITSDDPKAITEMKELQIEEGEINNYYNLIVNSNFQNDLIGWTQSDATDMEGNSIPNDDEIVTLSNGEKAYHRKCYYNQSKALDQVISIDGKKNDTYRLSFWYKNNGIREDGMFAGHIVTLGFDYINGDVARGTQMHNLNIHGTEWQFFNMTFTTLADYNKVRLSIISQTEVNDLYITHFTLTKDLGMNSYNYDSKGNIIAAVDQNNQKQTFNYDKNNQLVSTFEPKGNHFTFEYDNGGENKLLQGISTKGIANKLEYDNHNNPIKTKIFNSNSKELNGKSFYIRKKGTNLYITPSAYQNSVILAYPMCNKEAWTINQEGNNCTLKSSTSGKYLSVIRDNYIGLSEYSMEFQFLPKENGSYYIKYFGSSDALTSTGNYFELTPYKEDNSNQEFYLEPVNEEKYVEETAEYTSDGKYIKSKIDALGKRTNYEIDSQTGLTKSITDANKNTTKYFYNPKEQITKVEKEDRKIEYEYNNQDLLSKIICSNKEYHFTYDNFLNAKNVKINDNTLVTNEYENNNGNLIQTKYGNNDRISYTYDELDRLNTITKDQTYQFHYNNQNELVKIKSPNELYQYYYDFAGRIQNYSWNDYNIKYDYDINSNVLQKTFQKQNQINQMHYTYDEDDSIIKVTFDNQNLNYIYDSLGRLTKKNINNHLPVEYEYYGNGNKTSFILKSMKINEDLYEYTYDNLYNIKTIKKNKKIQKEYYYDNFNELIKEDNYIQNKTIKYYYDEAGNITSKKQCELKTDNVLHTDTYEYNNESWKDQLTKFNNTEITYDPIGNPLTIGNMSLEWQNGRELKRLTDPHQEISYSYNKDGIRKSKTVNNVVTNYFTENSTLIFEETNDNMIYFIRDDDNNLLGLKYNDTLYYYQKNIQEDITGIYDENYNLIATYEYDSWGNILSIKDQNNNDISNNASQIANINPFRYRSYYYDQETKLYYLNSRYYNPEWGRFINADGIIGISIDNLGCGLYIYCGNNPITNVDLSGNSFLKKIWQKVERGAQKVKEFIQVGLAGLAILGGKIKNMPISGNMFAKSFVSSKTPLSNRDKYNMATEVKKSPVVQKEIAKAIINATEPTISTVVEVNFSTGDLHNSIGKAKMEINGVNQGAHWDINVVLSDTYNFDENRPGLNFSDIMNNIGYAAQKKGILEAYEWDIKFHVKAPSKKGSF